EVRPVEHDLEREQDDQRAPAQQDPERADGEQDRRERDVPGDVGALHSGSTSGSPGSSCREWLPRMTPPTAAIRSATDVISNASRWLVRNSRPICAGLPRSVPLIDASCDRRPPALSPITTMISTRIAAA